MANKNAEMLELAQSILDDVEMCSASLTQLALRSSRLARLVGRFDDQQLFQYEASGYPSGPKGVPRDIWDILIKAGRVKHSADKENPGQTKQSGILSSIDQMEGELSSLRTSLEVSANAGERMRYMESIKRATSQVAARRGFIHKFVSEVYYELKFSSVAYDVFNRTREGVDQVIGKLVPDAVKKFSAVYENLDSQNTEDWSNAVHSCRRILQDTADAIYPARADKIVEVGGKEKVVKLGADNYINRLIAYVEENSGSDRFNEIVGSHMKYLGERLDAIFQAAQKGSHSVISSQDEADRYVIYTYLVVGDILKLQTEQEGAEQELAIACGQIVDADNPLEHSSED